MGVFYDSIQYVPSCIKCTKFEKCFPEPIDQVNNADTFPCPRFTKVRGLGGYLNEERVERRVRKVNKYAEQL